MSIGAPRALLTQTAEYGKLWPLKLVAEVAELADALDSKSSAFTGVWVRLPPSALLKLEDL